jgi:glutamate synthase (NADPH/NADH) small chain
MPQERSRVVAPVRRTRSFEEVHLGISRREAVEDARIFLEREGSVKGGPCPLGTDHFALLRALAKKDLPGALALLLETDPLPGVTGRLCDEPFSETQVFNRNGMQISLRAFERFLADQVKMPVWPVPVKWKQRVAVIGAGPAGLSAAWMLAKSGYKVTLIDAQRLLGGSLTFGWPEFVLPFHVITTIAQTMAARGIAFMPNTILGRNMSVQELFDQGFAAVVLATGAGVARSLGIPGEKAAGVMPAGDFLKCWREARLGALPQDIDVPVGKKVLVAGPGAAGVHAARVLLRKGHDVTVIVNGPESELKADASGVREAVEEGVKFKTFMRPGKIVEDHTGSVKGLVCRPIDYRIDLAGKLSLVADTDTDVLFEADTVLVAAGGSPDTLFYADTPRLMRTQDGAVIMDRANAATSVEGVFAAGAVTDPSMGLAEAMVSGKNAAFNVDRFLQP